MKLRNIINRATILIVVSTTTFTLELALAPVVDAETQKPVPTAKPALKPVASTKPVATTKPVAQVSKTKPKVKAKRDVFGPFVPPPPPNIPTFSSASEMGSFDIDLSGLSFLSEADLKARLASNELRLKNAQSKLKDQTALVDENKKRAQNFVELFDQGIVSKKELEGSSKDADQAVADLEEAKGKCKDLELTVKAMKERLGVLQKRKALSKANSKLIGSFETRKRNKSKSRPPSKQKIESKSSPEETTSDKSKK